MVFLKNGGVLFMLKAILLMFCLDLVRFICVVIGIVKHKVMNVSGERPGKVSIPVKA